MQKNYRVPTWFQDAKFGLFIHWGVYTVAARQSEWYPRHMYSTKDVADWHRDQFGPQDRVGYKDLVPLFTAEKFDPTAWAALFKKSGARYVVPTAEHHDGFALYDSALTRWDAKDMGPKRDLIGELAAAVRKEGLHFGVSNHRIEHWSFMFPQLDIPTDLFDPAYADFYGPPQAARTRDQVGDADVMNGRAVPQSAEFLEEWLLRCQEIIDKYQPEMLYFDNGVNSRALDPVKLRLAAYYYNRGAEWGKQFTLATKGYNSPEGFAYLHGSVLDFERGHPADLLPIAWQTDTTVHHRWSYLEDTLYRSTGTLIRELIDNVSKGGNLLLNFSPKADGTFPEEQVAILLGMGRWLDVNGDAIYGTRVWKKFGEGPSKLANPGNLPERDRVHREAVGDIWLPSYTGKDFRFTQKGGVLYAIAMKWPGNRLAVITSLAKNAGIPGEIKRVKLLGHSGVLQFTRDDEGLKIMLPERVAGEHAFAFAIEGLRLD